MPKGKINVYTCPHGHQTITIDKDNGTTPLIISCRKTLNEKVCKGDAKSAFYICDQTLKPEYEWVLPAPGQKINPIVKEYCDNGGLLLNLIGKPVISTLTAHQGRNEKCACGSGKKYKYCCLINN